jgi:hypothetical protein
MRRRKCNWMVVSWFGGWQRPNQKSKTNNQETTWPMNPNPADVFWRNEEWRMEKLKKPNGCDSNESRPEAKRTSHHWSKRLKVGSGSILKMRESCGGVLHTEKMNKRGKLGRLG